jgi:ParB/RepB/Spo0J family partition protein
MAAKWNLTVRRTDNGYYCDPNGIVPMQIRSPFSDLKIAELAGEMYRDGKQRDPGTVRRIAGVPHILDGNRRLAAVKYINAELLAEGEQPWEFWFVCQEVKNELEAVLTAATLNATMPMNPLDKAHMYQLAIREGNLTQDALAERIGKTAAHVSQHLSLLRLGEAEQTAIANGRIGFAAALELLGLSKESREQVVAQVTNADTPMSGTDIKELTVAARKAESADRSPSPEGEGDTPPSGGVRRKLALSASKFKDVINSLGERNVSFLPLANIFDMLWYGEITEQDLEDEWATFVAKLHFDHLEELKKAGRIKGVA